MEHPNGSRLRTYPEVRSLISSYSLLSCHMCRYGLRLPKDDKLIKKATSLVASHDDMSVVAKECPGFQHPKHSCHQPIARSCKEIRKIGTYAGGCTPAFVCEVSEAVPDFRMLSQSRCVECHPWTQQQEQEVITYNC